MSIDSLDIVKKLIAGTENGEVEFKETTGQLERGMETLCAFLNGTGGTALFGVTDKGKITGQEVADSTKRNIAEAINRLEPAAAVQVSYIPLSDSGKKIVALHVEESWLDRPFSYKGRAYMRVESVTTAMPQSVYNKLLLQREGIKHNWEAYPNYSLKLSDLDDDEIMKTVRLGIEQGRLPETTGNDITAILEKFGLLEDNVLNHAAAVLFAKKKLMDYPQCLLRLARFKGTDKTVFMDNRRIHGNLFQLLDAAMAFIFKHLSLSATTDTLEREEHLTVPYKAIREGVINSLCHRSYRAAGGSVGIAIYDDRVEIENPGSFPMGWDMEKIKSKHASKPQNPLIADVLYIRKILESWGRGIGLIMSECQKANLPEPEYWTDSDEVRLIFRYQAIDHPSTGQVPDKYRTSTGQVPDKYRTSTGQVPDKYRTSTGQVEPLIRLIGENRYSVKEIMELLQLKHRENFLNNYLNPSMDAGLVEPLYPDQPWHPKQKYLLTEKGKALLK